MIPVEHWNSFKVKNH